MAQEILITNLDSFLANKTRRSNSEFTRKVYGSNVRKFFSFLDSYYQIDDALEARKKAKALSEIYSKHRKRGNVLDAEKLEPEIKKLEMQADLAEKPFFDQMKDGKIDVYKLLDDYGNFIHTKTSTGRILKSKTQRDRIYTAKKFLQYLRIRIDAEDFKQFVTVPRKHRTSKKAITKEEIQKVLRHSPSRLQTVILVAVASAMRVGEIVQLRGSDIIFDVKTTDGRKITQINIRAETTKTRTSRMTFLTTEAGTALKEYLNKYFDWKNGENADKIKDQYIFGRVSMSKRAVSHSVFNAEHAVQKILAWVIRKTPDLQEKLENGRYKIHFHGFREYCKTKLSNIVGQDYSEMILGHEEGMSGIYYSLTDSEKADLYLKAELALTISDFVSIEKSQIELIRQNHELQRQINEIRKQLSLSETRTSKT